MAGLAGPAILNMKKRSPSVRAVVAAMVAGLVAPAMVGTARGQATDGPRIEFAATNFDFGRRVAGEVIQTAFAFTNTGAGTLVIRTVSPSCGCASVTNWTKEVPAGHGGVIPLEIRTAGKFGPFGNGVTVTCNDAARPAVELRLTGHVFRLFEVEPANPVLQCTTEAPDAAVTVKILTHDEGPIEVFAPECDGPRVAATLVTNVIGKDYQLRIATAPPVAPGGGRAIVSLRTTCTNLPKLQVPVGISVMPAVSVIPPQITLPRVRQKELTTFVSLINRSTNALVLAAPTVNVEGIQATLEETQPGRQFRIRVTVPANFKLPAGKPVEVSLASNNPLFPVLKIPLRSPLQPVRRTAAQPAAGSVSSNSTSRALP